MNRECSANNRTTTSCCHSDNTWLTFSKIIMCSPWDFLINGKSFEITYQKLRVVEFQ